MPQINDGPVLAVQTVSRTYVGPDGASVQALSDASLSIRAGEMGLIHGRSGSGKTTLLGIMGLLDMPQSGQVFCLGTDMTGMEEGERADMRRRAISFLFQRDRLLEHKSILANVVLPLTYAGMTAKISKDRAVDALVRFGLGERMHHTPLQLSGGERIRAGLARALVGERPVLICDEPTSALDAETGAMVICALREAADCGVAVLVASHDPAFHECADWSLHMNAGRVEAMA